MTQDNILSRSIVLPYLHHNTSHHSHNLFSPRIKIKTSMKFFFPVKGSLRNPYGEVTFNFLSGRLTLKYLCVQIILDSSIFPASPALPVVYSFSSPSTDTETSASAHTSVGTSGQDCANTGHDNIEKPVKTNHIFFSIWQI